MFFLLIQRGFSISALSYLVMFLENCLVHFVKLDCSVISVWNVGQFIVWDYDSYSAHSQTNKLKLLVFKCTCVWRNEPPSALPGFVLEPSNAKPKQSHMLLQKVKTFVLGSQHVGAFRPTSASQQPSAHTKVGNFYTPGSSGRNQHTHLLLKTS